MIFVFISKTGAFLKDKPKEQPGAYVVNRMQADALEKLLLKERPVGVFEYMFLWVNPDNNKKGLSEKELIEKIEANPDKTIDGSNHRSAFREMVGQLKNEVDKFELGTTGKLKAIWSYTKNEFAGKLMPVMDKPFIYRFK